MYSVYINTIKTTFIFKIWFLARLFQNINLQAVNLKKKAV